MFFPFFYEMFEPAGLAAQEIEEYFCNYHSTQSVVFSYFPAPNCELNFYEIFVLSLDQRFVPRQTEEQHPHPLATPPWPPTRRRRRGSSWLRKKSQNRRPRVGMGVDLLNTLLVAASRSLIYIFLCWEKKLNTFLPEGEKKDLAENLD